MKIRSLNIEVDKCFNFSLVLFIMFFSAPSMGQIVDIGTGTATNTITQSSPINIGERRNASYIVYTAAELTAAGAIGAGEISQLGFFVTNAPVYNLPDYEIQIKHTSAANANGVSAGGFTTVKTIDSYHPNAGGWDMLTLDSPFEWNGSQNIVIRICWSSIPEGSDNSGQVRIFSSSRGYKYYGGWFAYGSGCSLNPVFNVNYKPHIRFVFQDETVWTGADNSNWFNADNWSAGVPNNEMDVLIPSGLLNYPEVNGIAVGKNVSVVGDLVMLEWSELKIYGDLNVSGSFTDLGGEVSFNGTGLHEINATEPTSFYNLKSNSSSGFSITNRMVSINNALRIEKGTVYTNDSLTIASSAIQTGRIDEIKTTCVYTVNMEDTYGDGWNGASLNIYEDGELLTEIRCHDEASSATFHISKDRELMLEYISGSYENENSYSLIDEDGDVLFEDGPNPTTGVVYTSIATGCSFENSIEGDITMERYIDAGETYWRYFASAVENPKVQQYLDDFTTSGFEGAHYPSFPFNSIASYDESLPPGEGYVFCESVEQIIEVGQGYQVWSGDTITGTDAFKVDLTGPANQGNIALPVTYTFSGTPSEDGWNLVGNPYASTINWDDADWVKTNMANAIYIQDPDTKLYAAYVAGAGVNGGSKYIASQQSFWVQAIAADPELSVKEGVKSNVDAVFYEPTELSAGMTVKINGFDKEDQAVLRHVDGASLEMEYAYDALDLFGGWGSQPQLSLMNEDGQDFAIQSFDKGNETWVLPMRVIVFESGEYELSFHQIFELGVPCMMVEDVYTGEFYSVEEGAPLTFYMVDSTYAPRFNLHIGRELYPFKENVTCHNGENGSIEIDLGEEMVVYSLTYEGETVSDFDAANPLIIDSLSSGAYVLELIDYDDLCGQTEFGILINQPSALAVDAMIIDEFDGTDGAIEVAVTGGVEPYDYTWDCGENTSSLTGLDAGDYSVEIKDANDCLLDTTFIVSPTVLSIEEDNMSNFEGYLDRMSNVFYISNSLNQSVVSAQIIDANGRLITEQVINNSTNLSVDMNLGLSNGLYFVRLSGEEETLHVFKVIF
ncbi:T9SS type A sorting domain-containing protein [Crocinitomix algicola]|uniref:T9SS type A sorting domain-containing protein n=1 Tax=Crocinitomix algicola TaxID=1740263 RepID=UPI0009F6A801|nr:T9SS type A sorting domain-containing protein [Crocinitomix algicola]